MTKEFTELQPKDGQRVATCGHLESMRSHFYYVEGGLKFIRPDGSISETEWLIMCDECFLESVMQDKGPEHFMRHDDIWHGDQPYIEKDEPN